jgi:hypothetical protein
MTLPDSSFFELMRSIFGNIKTPVNKQRLMEDLSAFLSRDEIRRTISLYIDETDAMVIAAVAALHTPAPGELERFFAGELGYADLQDVLLNLEERFILYRFRENGVICLALNPALEPALAPFAADQSWVFPSITAEEAAAAGASPAPALPLDDRLLAAIISFVPGEGALFKNEGGLRKKVLDTGAVLFPGLDLELITGGLLTLGLVRPDGEGLAPDDANLAAFQGLSPHDRRIYCAAGIYCWGAEAGGSFTGNATEDPAAGLHVLRGRIRSLAALIRHFLEQIDPARAYPLQTLRRCWGVLEQDEGRVHFEKLLEGLEKTGLLRCFPAGYRTAGPGTAAHSITAASNNAGAPALAMDTPFSCIIYPGISFADALALASFAVVRETGATVRFELTRESAVRGFDRGFTAEAMIELLNRLSGNRVAELLIWTLKDWQKRCAEVSLCEGIVLSLSADRRYLAEAEPVASLILRTIVPGVYLLSAPESRDAAEALRKAGVDIFARYRRPEPRRGRVSGDTAAVGGAAVSGESRYTPYPSPAVLSRYYRHGAAGIRFSAVDQAVPGPGAFDAEGREALKEQFRSALNRMQLPRGERDELSARIERRLVLSEAQLSGASLRYEKLEARGLDYVGKAAIAKQAIASKSLVEVKWPHAADGLQQAFGIPLALEKWEGESVLVINPVSQAADDTSPQLPGNTIRIPLGKISLLRRIKKSIFGE